LAGLAILHVMKPTGVIRVLLFMLIAFVSIRYFTWRTLYTIPPMDSSGFIPGVLLYLAELQGMTVYLLGIFLSARHLRQHPPGRPPRSPAPRRSRTAAGRRYPGAEL
jgi:cellulose synthase (UDP-forming)